MRFVVVWDHPEFDKHNEFWINQLQHVADHELVLIAVGASWKNEDQEVQKWALFYKLLYTCIQHKVWEWPPKKGK